MPRGFFSKPQAAVSQSSETVSVNAKDHAETLREAVALAHFVVTAVTPEDFAKARYGGMNLIGNINHRFFKLAPMEFMKAVFDDGSETNDKEGMN